LASAASETEQENVLELGCCNLPVGVNLKHFVSS
jgi:hypothetical protein